MSGLMTSTLRVDILRGHIHLNILEHPFANSLYHIYTHHLYTKQAKIEKEKQSFTAVGVADVPSIWKPAACDLTVNGGMDFSGPVMEGWM